MKKIEIDKDILKQKHIDENLDCKTISMQLGIRYEIVKRRLKEYGLFIPRREHKSPYVSIHSDVEEEIVNKYKENVALMDLVREYNINRCVIQTMLKKYGIKLRKRTVSYNYDIHAFDKLTPESCYWAGFIAADGNLRKNRNALSIKLSIVDKEHLEKFARFIKFQGKIQVEEPICLSPLKQYCKISICGEFLPNALLKNFKITPQKTYTIQPPDLPDELMTHYIRGYFDGDGSISGTKRPTCVATFSSGSMDMLEFLRHYFRNKNIIVRKNKFNQTEMPNIQMHVQICYSCSNALKLCDIIYNQSTQNTRLDRKYNLYLYWKQIKDNKETAA